MLKTGVIHLSAAMLLLLFPFPALSRDVRFVTDFGAFPDDAKDDTESLRTAATQTTAAEQR